MSQTGKTTTRRAFRRVVDSARKYLNRKSTSAHELLKGMSEGLDAKGEVPKEVAEQEPPVVVGRRLGKALGERLD